MKKQNTKQGGARRDAFSFGGQPRSHNELSFVLPGLSIEAEFQAATQHHMAGRLGEAERICRKILAYSPRHADALHVCGVVAAQTGRLEAAAELMGQAIEANPMVALYYKNCANALKDAGKLDKATETLRRCLRVHSRDAEAHFQLGTIIGPAGQVDEAIQCFREAIRHNSNYAEAWNKLGMALAGKKQIEEAITAFHRSLRLQQAGPTWSNLGSALTIKGDMAQAIEAYRMALRLTPDAPETWCNFGMTLQANGSFKESIAAYEKAIQLKPEREFAHWNLSQVLLMQGDFQRGWAEYEWRWLLKDFRSPPCIVPQPQWRGEDLNGRTILVHLEQGRGDVIQFIRYVPSLIERGAQVIVYCRNELVRLLGSVTGVTRMTVGAESVAFDMFVPLMSIPHVLGTTMETIPATVPYVHAEPELAEAWRRRLASASGKLRVGLVWAGSSTHPNDSARSITLAQCAPLARVPGVTFFSLQKGDTSAMAANPPAGMELIDHTADLTDFVDTAALISNLDLVITVDTAVAHLAGAMGKAVWVMIPFVPDWRWLLDRDDSPWYPSMRLFRQETIGNWAGVIERLAGALEAMASFRNETPGLMAA